MTLSLNIPEWGVWMISIMLGISAAVNVWHGMILRRYRKELNQAIMRPRTDPIEFAR